MEIADFDKPIANPTNFDILPNDEFEPYNSKELTPENESCRIKYIDEPSQCNEGQDLLSKNFAIVFPRSKKVKQLNGIDRDHTFYDPVYGIVYSTYYYGKFTILPLYECKSELIREIEFHD